MVLGQSLPVVLKRIERARGDDSRLAHTAAKLLANTSGLFNMTELTLDTVGGASATTYDAVEVPAGNPNNGWDPGNGMFFLDANNILKLELDLDAIGGGGGGNGVTPNTGTTIQFLPGAGPVVQEFFVTPPSYGGNRYIDLTNL